MLLIKNNIMLMIICVITSFIMVFISPFITIYWLLLISIYLLYKRYFLYIFIVWLFYFSFWYFLFTLIFFDFGPPILIGGEHTSTLMNYIGARLLKYPFLTRFTAETVFFFHLIGDHYGITIYVPSIIGALVEFLLFLFGKGGKGGSSAKCSPAKDSKDPSSPGPSPGVSPTDLKGTTIFSQPSSTSSTVNASTVKKDCGDLSAVLSNRKGKLWSYPFDWESEKVSTTKKIFAFRANIPNSFLVPQSIRGTNIHGCAEFEGFIVDALSKSNEKK